MLQVKLAEFSKTPEDFLRKYEELKSKNVRNLDPLVYLLSKLSEDKEVTNGQHIPMKLFFFFLLLTSFDMLLWMIFPPFVIYRHFSSCSIMPKKEQSHQQTQLQPQLPVTLCLRPAPRCRCRSWMSCERNLAM